MLTKAPVSTTIWHIKKSQSYLRVGARHLRSLNPGLTVRGNFNYYSYIIAENSHHCCFMRTIHLLLLPLTFSPWGIKYEQTMMQPMNRVQMDSTLSCFCHAQQCVQCTTCFQGQGQVHLKIRTCFGLYLKLFLQRLIYYFVRYSKPSKSNIVDMKHSC